MDDSASVAQTGETEQCVESRDQSFLTMLREALNIPVRNIRFTGFTLITSLPLLFLMIFFQALLESSLHDLIKFERPLLPSPERYIPYYHFFAGIQNLSKVFSRKLMLLSLIYFIPLPILQFLAAYSTIYLTSKVYKNGNPSSSNNMLINMKGISITSLIVFSLSTSLFMGIILLSIVLYGCNFVSYYDIAIIVIYLAGLAAGIPRYLEVSAMLNLSLVVSVLGRIHGIDALVVSLRFSKGKEKLGCCLMMIFFVWEFLLRVSCMFFDDGSFGIIVRATWLWLGCLMKWVVCVVYCYECMGMVLEKRMAGCHGGGFSGGDGEEGRLTSSLLKDDQ